MTSQLLHAIQIRMQLRIISKSMRKSGSSAMDKENHSLSSKAGEENRIILCTKVCTVVDYQKEDFLSSLIF